MRVSVSRLRAHVLVALLPLVAHRDRHPQHRGREVAALPPRPARRKPLLTAARVIAGLGCAALAQLRAGEPVAPAIAPTTIAVPRELSLDECVAAALQNNHRRPASRFAVAAAEAQLQQALSGYWPQLRLQGAYQHLDEPPNFVFPAGQMGVPAQTITTPPSTAVVTVPAGVLGPTAVQLPVSVPGQSITTPAQIFPIPAQDIKVMNPDAVVGSVNLTWLLFDGGLRSGLRQQAAGFVEAMKQEARRTDLEIADSVARMYYGAVLCRQLHTLGFDTLARMEATLGLTETMYKEGSGKVKKTDFLDNKVMVESLRSMVAVLAKNEAMAQAALANTLGLPWQASVTPRDTEIPLAAPVGDLAALVSAAYEFSPDWKQLEAALSAREGAVRSARSGHAPRIALTGNLHAWWNSYDAGMATPQNKDGWTVGVGLELPIFDGFLTRSQVAAARARLDQLKQQQFLLQEGLGLELKDIFLSLAALRASADATAAAKSAATENCDLNTRAYQNELVETEKVIRAQLMEALMSAQHFKTLYDLAALHSRLTVVVGSEMRRRLEPR